MLRASGAASPLARVARAVPDGAGAALATVARLTGAALALYIAADATYDRTQVFGIVLAAYALASLAPLPGVAGVFVASGGAGMLFFGGASLWSEAAGPIVLAAGVVAWCGTLADGARRGVPGMAPVTGFFAALALLVGTVVVIALAVEG